MEALNTSSPGPKAAVRKHFDFTRLLVLRDRLPWFWFFFMVVVLVLSAIDRYHIISQFKQRERVVIIDPAGTYYLSPLLQFSEAKELHVQQAELATLAFLERNPKDFDNSDLLKLLFLKKAFEKAQDERNSEAVEFRAKELHQKAEIGQIESARLTFWPPATMKCWRLSPARLSAPASSRTGRSPKPFRSRSGCASSAIPIWL
jgi:hypothetical protein